MYGDRSPDISPEEKRKHDLEAEKFKYKIALDELSFYIDRSVLHTASHRNTVKERAWTDHQGRVWVTENPISPAARNELGMILEVIRDYEKKHGEKEPRGSILSDIANIRATSREQSPNRLTYFEGQASQSEPAKPVLSMNAEKIPEHEIEIER